MNTFFITVPIYVLLMRKYLCLPQNWRLKINVDLQLIKDSQIFWVVIKLGILSSLASAFQICRSTFDKLAHRGNMKERKYIHV